MRRFKLQKLVRDKVLDNILAKGNKVVSHKLNDKNFVLELKKKLLEECNELNLSQGNNIIDEIADVQEVIDNLLKVLKVKKKKIKEILKNKVKKAGSFKKRTYIETVDLNDNDEWIKYYTKNFTEIKIK